MMLPTHALAGMALGVPLLFFAPEFGVVALASGFVGGVLPDLDMYVGHRKTLHYPIYYPGLATLAAVVAVLSPSSASVAVAFVLLGAGLHSVTDVWGGGLELRPWEATSTRAVYDHYNARWIAPRRLVRYDGSPGDLLLSATLGSALLPLLEGSLYWLVVATTLVAVVYTAVRRILPDLAERLVEGLLPKVVSPKVLDSVPPRYRGGRGGQ